MLEIGIDTYYKALFGIDLELRQGEIVCLLGRNGAGKTTCRRSVMGLTPPRRGRIAFEGRDITGWRPDQVCRAGIGWVPEDRRIFGRLTVHENLRFAAESCPRAGAWTLERIYELFPKLQVLREHMGTQLSGGEQQMLAIGRTLAVNSRVVLLDEPCEGLAPVVVANVGHAISAIRETGTAVFLVEQNAKSRCATQIARTSSMTVGSGWRRRRRRCWTTRISKSGISAPAAERRCEDHGLAVATQAWSTADLAPTPSA